MGNGATVHDLSVPATGRVSKNGHRVAASNGHDPAHLNGNGATPYRDRVTGEPSTGAPLSQQQLEANRAPVEASASA